MGTIGSDRPYFTSQLITYIGNKRTLLPFIHTAVEKIKRKCGRKKLLALDGFSGSGAVSRLLKSHSRALWVNDLEDYCAVINQCYLANRSAIDVEAVRATTERLNAEKLGEPGRRAGFFERNYAPKDDENIRPGERVFYTRRNARIIDTLKRLIRATVPENQRHFYLAPLIVKASVHTNTSGVFKGFHKRNGIGCFGGHGRHALSRIKKEISLEVPVWSDAECDVHVHKRDVNELVRSGDCPPCLDIAYFDPPYNQHPYGSNYFMLNLIAGGAEEVPIQDGVSGIARDWNRSAYNKKKRAEEALEDLVAGTRAKYILISYNNEGIIPAGELRRILSAHGKTDVLTREYNTYRGSRNLRGRSIKVQEQLWVLNKN